MTKQKSYLVTWRYADGHTSTFTFTDKEKALFKYSQGRFGGRKVGRKVVRWLVFVLRRFINERLW